MVKCGCAQLLKFFSRGVKYGRRGGRRGHSHNLLEKTFQPFFRLVALVYSPVRKRPRSFFFSTYFHPTVLFLSRKQSCFTISLSYLVISLVFLHLSLLSNQVMLLSRSFYIFRYLFLFRTYSLSSLYNSLSSTEEASFVEFVTHASSLFLSICLFSTCFEPSLLPFLF